jgi:hypothetical protein
MWSGRRIESLGKTIAKLRFNVVDRPPLGPADMKSAAGRAGKRAL